MPRHEICPGVTMYPGCILVQVKPRDRYPGGGTNIHLFFEYKVKFWYPQIPDFYPYPGLFPDFYPYPGLNVVCSIERSTIKKCTTYRVEPSTGLAAATVADAATRSTQPGPLESGIS